MALSQESITILGVGVALAGLILVQGNCSGLADAQLAQGLADVRAELVDVRAEIADVRERLARVETRLTHVETQFALPATNDASVAATIDG